jgi:UDP-glucose 4-epimerase
VKVVITGSRGFIGQAVAKKLDGASIDVYGYDRQDGLDILDYDAIQEDAAQADVVIHLAGVLGTHELFDTPDEAVQVNVQGSLNVIRACAEGRTRYIGISMPDAFPSMYTATKIASIRIADAYAYSMGLKRQHVVAYNAFGPGQAWGPGHPQKIIPTFIEACLNGRPMPIWGDGSQWVDLIHVDNLAQCFLDAIDTPNHEVFHGGSGVSWTVLEVAHMVADLVGVNPLVEFLPMRRGERPTQIVAANPHVKISVDLLESQLADTVRWYRKQAEL